MVLSVKERLVLLNMLPTSGSFVDLMLYRNLREALQFGPEEMEELSFKVDGGQVNWDPEAAGEGKEFKLLAHQIVKVGELLQDMDKEKQLTDDHVSLYEKFVEVEG